MRLPPATPRAAAPIDLTGYWVSVVTEDWAWRMRTPPKGDYASMPLNAAGKRAADSWTAAQEGSCLAFGAPSMLRMPTRAHITWADDQTLRLETDNGVQTRLLRFGPAPADPAGAPSLQGHSVASWQRTLPPAVDARRPHALVLIRTAIHKSNGPEPSCVSTTPLKEHTDEHSFQGHDLGAEALV